MWQQESRARDLSHPASRITRKILEGPKPLVETLKSKVVSLSVELSLDPHKGTSGDSYLQFLYVLEDWCNGPIESVALDLGDEGLTVRFYSHFMKLEVGGNKKNLANGKSLCSQGRASNDNFRVGEQGGTPSILEDESNSPSFRVQGESCIGVNLYATCWRSEVWFYGTWVQVPGRDGTYMPKSTAVLRRGVS